MVFLENEYLNSQYKTTLIHKSRKSEEPVTEIKKPRPHAVMLHRKKLRKNKLKDSDGKNRGISNISVVFIMLLSVAFYESRDFNENYTIKPLQSYMVDIAKNKNKNVVLFRFEDGVNFLETLDVPYKKYKEVSEFKDDIEKNRDIVIIVREKDVKKLKDLEKNSNYEVLFKNYSFYLIEIKRVN